MSSLRLPRSLLRVGKAIWRRIGPSGVVVAVALAFAAARPEGLPGMEGSWGLIRVLLVFFFMGVLLRHRVTVGVVILMGALALGVLFHVPWRLMAHVFTYGVFSAEQSALHDYGRRALVLILMVYLINFMGRTMEAGGGLECVIESLGHIVRDVRYVLAIIPAIIGLLPMPGGALLSAPLVGKLGERLKLDSEAKTLANYWFRHVWEYCWPLYPGLMIASKLLTDVSAPEKLQTKGQLPMLVWSHAPLSLFAIFIGWLFLLRRVEHQRAGAGAAESLSIHIARVAAMLWPVMVVACAVMLSLAGPKWFQDVVFVGALVVVNSLFIAQRRLSGRQIVKVLRQSITFSIILLVLGIFVLMAMVDVSGAANGIGEAFRMYSIPPGIAAFLLPMIVGLLTGYTAGGVGATLPFLIKAGAVADAGTIMLSYSGALLGVLLSPVHLCLVLTREYYEADLEKVYRQLLLPILSMAAGAALLATVL